ncbi:MAG: hypothetical protein IPJ49_20175 [Candidatus Obscuribacter sp.]|nr:hypothetical protein [Candidatus Obscuribacter sp.]
MSQPTQVTVTKNDIVEASRRGAMSPQDVESLWAHLAAQAAGKPSGDNSKSFDIAQIAWYGGGVLVMIAMAWVYGACCYADWLWRCTRSFFDVRCSLCRSRLQARHTDGQKTPGGLLFTLPC